jgi:ribose 5-phosphate isomerase B
MREADMRIAVGCDSAAVTLKQTLEDFLEEVEGVESSSFGVESEDDPEYYPDVAERVARAVANGDYDRGLLLCGTGLGMAITANKVPGIRAATCHDVYSAERARKSNDAQILTMGARVIGPESAKAVLKAWLESEFGGGRSTPKVARIKAIERKYCIASGA